MTKKQVLNFFKAPFSKSFIVAYFFSFFMLMAVPLISEAIYVLFDKIEDLNVLEQNEAIKLFFTSLMERVDAWDVVMAVIGFFISYFLFSLYFFLLVHKTVSENKGIFDFSCISLKLTEILSVALKYFCFMLIYFGGLLLPFLAGIVLALLGFLVSQAVGLIMIFVGLIVCFILLYKIFCHLYTASLIFYKEFNLSVFFEKKRVKEYFVSHKENILISFLLSYVLSQVVYVIYSSVFFNLLQEVFSVNVFLQLFDVSSQIVVSIGLFVFNFVFIYLMILQAIAFGKIILWVEKNK